MMRAANTLRGQVMKSKNKDINDSIFGLALKLVSYVGIPAVVIWLALYFLGVIK
jgi:hypothetical protein